MSSIKQRADGGSWVRASIGFGVLAFLAVASQSMVANALPAIAGDFDSIDHSTWVLSAYLLTFAAVMPAYGALVDQFDPRIITIASVAVFAVGATLCWFTPAIEGLIVGRALQGIGGGGMFVASQTVMATAAFRHNVRYMAALGGILAIATLAGPLLGSLVIEVSGWRSIFWISLATAVIGAALSLPGHSPVPAARKQRRIDFGGIAILMVMTVVLIGALSLPFRGQSVGALIVATLVLVCCAIALFVVERRAVYPVLPLHIFRNRNFLLITISSLLMGIATFGFIAYVPMFLQISHAESVVEAGLFSVPLILGAALSSNVAGHLAVKYQLFKESAAIGAVVVAAGLYLGATFTMDSPDWVIVLSMFLVGVGVGAGNQLLTVVVQRSLPAELIGRGTAANGYFRHMGLAIGATFVGGVFSLRLSLALVDVGMTAGDLPTPDEVQLLLPAVQSGLALAYQNSLMPLFALLAPLALVRAVLLLLIRTPSHRVESLPSDDPQPRNRG